MACGGPADHSSIGAHGNGSSRPFAPSTSVWRPAGGCSRLGARPGVAAGSHLLMACNTLCTAVHLLECWDVAALPGSQLYWPPITWTRQP